MTTDTMSAKTFLRISRRLGIGNSAMWILIELHPAGRVLTLASLSRTLGVSSAAMTGLVDGLEAKELVKRTRGGMDRRTVGLSLTLKGRAALEEKEVVA